MSGPKHLWSGDWENESEDATTQRVREPRPEPAPEAPAPEPRAPRRPRRSVRPWVLPVAVGVLVIAAAAFGLSKVFGTSQPSHPNTISARNPLPPPHVTGNTRPIMWLGMEIITGPQGTPLVETVRPLQQRRRRRPGARRHDPAGQQPSGRIDGQHLGRDQGPALR